MSLRDAKDEGAAAVEARQTAKAAAAAALVADGGSGSGAEEEDLAAADADLVVLAPRAEEAPPAIRARGKVDAAPFALTDEGDDDDVSAPMTPLLCLTRLLEPSEKRMLL
jgi:hypothetical protein